MKQGIYIARDEKRTPRVVVVVDDNATAIGVNEFVALYHDIALNAVTEEPISLTCATQAEFKHWYRPRRQFLFWKERI